ncbi:hypothetical protein DRP77_10500, partial [Candidatus Poribacteria bacterium]
ARALANQPRIIFADEPTANLDSRQSANIMELVKELKREHGVTIVVVSHQVELQKDADRVIRMKDGRIVEEIRRRE